MNKAGKPMVVVFPSYYGGRKQQQTGLIYQRLEPNEDQNSVGFTQRTNA